MTINQNLFDLQVEHLLLTRRYSDGVKKEINDLAKSHRSRLWGILRKDVTDYESVQRESTRWAQELYSLSKSRVEDFVGAEIDFQVNALKKNIGSVAPVQSLNRGEVARAITSNPLRLSDKETNTLLRSTQHITSQELTKINALIRRGLAKGDSEDAIIQAVVRTSKLTEAQASTLVGTNISHAQTLIKQKLLEKNDTILKGVVFTAILDSRTSKICSQYDGLFQSSDNIKVRPPLHYNCRSTLVPVVRGKEELLQLNSPVVNSNALEQDPNWSGELPVKENFGQWLRRQDMATKMKYLGDESKVALLEEGNLSWKDFFTAKGNPISLAALRTKDNLLTWMLPTKQKSSAVTPGLAGVARPFQLVRSDKLQKDLRDLYIADAANGMQSLSLMDYRGTTLAGKRSVRHRANNVLDERATSFDPFTGESKSTLYYDPDFNLLQERLDYMKNSKLLDRNQKDFIEKFVNSMEDRVSVNQQVAITENLRTVFERYQKNPQPWEDFSKVIRAEMNYSVLNSSQLLDRRSRLRDQLFLKFTGDVKEPSVQIMGETISISDLQKNKLKNENFVRDWKDTQGREFARSLFYHRKAPWRAYFFNTSKPPDTIVDKLYDSVTKRTIRKLFYKDDPFTFYQKYGKTPKKVTDILWDAVKKKFKRKKWSVLENIEKEGLEDFFKRTIREKYRYIIDLQFLRLKDRRSFSDKLLSSAAKPLEGDAIRVLSGIIEVIADGTMTDYDSLAIAIGKQLRNTWTPFRWWMGSSLQDYHSEGSKILEFLREQKVIRVNARGVTRRSVIDLDTGRPSGAFKDTVSREVQILDPKMLSLQSANRQIELANRFGVDRPENKYYVVPGKKTYVDARGKDTGVPIVTRSAFANFDEKIIDKDFADMLNHTMNTKWEVDPEFASFMDDVARFRDNRGRAEYYDDLNGFRQIIMQRGDMGYGLMETIRYYQATGKPFTAHARIDGRGRVYFNGYLTPTGGELVRPFLNSHKATPMTPEGLHQIKIQLAAVIGPGQEALTNAGRYAIFDRHEKSLLEIGKLFTETTQRDRRIREFLEHPLVQEIDPKELPKVARFALEYYRIHQHTGGKFDEKSLATYSSKLTGEVDASASGLQIIALSTGDRGAAFTSNILPSTRKNRIYDLVGQDTVADPRFQKLMEELNLDLSWEDLGKASKYQVIAIVTSTKIP